MPAPSAAADVFARFARASQNFSKKVLAFGWIIPYIKSSQADMAQLVEHNLAKVGVAGSSPVVRSIWAFSSGGERFPDTEEVRSSNLLTPTKCSQLRGFASELFCFTAPSQESAVVPEAAQTARISPRSDSIGPRGYIKITPSGLRSNTFPGK